MSDNETSDSTERVGFWTIVGSVLMSFLGVQSGAARERDFRRGSPVMFIAIGLTLTVLFVLTLVLVVRFVLAGAGV